MTASIWDWNGDLALVRDAHGYGPLELIVDFYKAFNERDVERALEYLDEHFDWRPAFGRGLLGSNAYVGRVGFQRYVADVAEVFDEYAVELLSIEQFGERVVVTNNTVGRSRRSGVSIDQRFTIVYRVRDGLIAAGRTYRERADADRDARVA